MMKKLVACLVISCLAIVSSTALSVEDAVLVGTVKMRSKTIELYSSHIGQLYTVSVGNQVLADKVTEHDLKAQFPSVYQMVKEGVSRDASISPVIMKGIEQRTSPSEF